MPPLELDGRQVPIVPVARACPENYAKQSMLAHTQIGCFGRGAGIYSCYLNRLFRVVLKRAVRLYHQRPVVIVALEGGGSRAGRDIGELALVV